MAASQPDNDFCLDAIRISDVTRYCSRVGEFTNAGATYNSANDVAGEGPCRSAPGRRARRG